MGVEHVPEAKDKQKAKDKDKKKSEEKRDISIKGTLKAIKDRQRLLDEV